MLKIASFSNVSPFSPIQAPKMHKITSLENDMRKFLRPKFWSLGTNLGDPRGLVATPGVQGFPRWVILVPSGMVHITVGESRMAYFFAHEWPSVVMCLATKEIKYRSTKLLNFFDKFVEQAASELHLEFGSMLYYVCDVTSFSSRFNGSMRINLR